MRLLWVLSAFALIVLLYGVLFHLVMLHEGRYFPLITGVHWTLTVMSTTGFVDIAFQSDTGRIFTTVVLVSGVTIMLVLLPLAFVQLFLSKGRPPQGDARC